MHVDLTSIDELTNALGQNMTGGLECVDGLSLGAAMELAVWAIDAPESPRIIEDWKGRSAHLAEALRLLRGGRMAEPVNAHARVWDDVRPVRSRQCVSENGWQRFLERFAAALKEAGFKSGWHQAMAAVLHEMADNVVQHSSLGSAESMNGVAGYSVSARRMAFTVADSGVGAVRSLRSNPDYAHIANGREALDLIARERASCRAGQGVGNGYHSLFIQLAAMNGRVRLRSADGVFTMEGTLGVGCSPVSRSLHPVSGFHVSVECEI